MTLPRFLSSPADSFADRRRRRKLRFEISQIPRRFQILFSPGWYAVPETKRPRCARRTRMIQSIASGMVNTAGPVPKSSSTEGSDAVVALPRTDTRKLEFKLQMEVKAAASDVARHLKGTHFTADPCPSDCSHRSNWGDSGE